MLCLNRAFKLRARKNLGYKNSISLISRVIFSSVDEIIIFSWSPVKNWSTVLESVQDFIYHPSAAVLISQIWLWTSNFINSSVVMQSPKVPMPWNKRKKNDPEDWKVSEYSRLWNVTNSCGYSKINNRYQTNGKVMKRKQSEGVLIRLFYSSLT